MPVHPTEESAPSNITDKVAKESRDSTASDHPLHNENEGPVKGTSRDHAGKGPAIPESMFRPRKVTAVVVVGIFTDIGD